MKSKPIALVTGATSGIGEATAHRLHDRGYTVFAAGRNPEALNTLRSKGLQARSLDVTDEAAVARLVEEINVEHGGVDVLVNSAGYPLPRPLEQVELSELRHLFETNVVATLHLSQAVLPAMRARGSGRIVTIGSTGGRFTSPGAGRLPHGEVRRRGSLAVAGRRGGAVRCSSRVDRSHRGADAFRHSQFETEHSYPDDDPYGHFKIRYSETTRRLATTTGLTVDADTVARAVVRVVKAKNPKPRYIVGASGKASVLARALLSDRMWNRVMTTGMRG